MNNKMIICMTGVLLFVSGLAVAKPDAESFSKTHPGFKSRSEYVAMKVYGGRLRKPGSARGCFVFLNAQKVLSSANLRPALNQIDRTIHPEVKLVDASVTVTTIKDAVKNAGGNLGVAIIDDAAWPTLLTAPEDGWALVNVAALKRDNPTSEKLASRVRKEMLRGFALTGGCAFMCRAPIVMRDVVTLPELDDIELEELGVDAIAKLRLSLPEHGITPWNEQTYRVACQQGWAPAPTNEYQKAIWDKVHAVPKNPMKIEFDPKKGR